MRCESTFLIFFATWLSASGFAQTLVPRPGASPVKSPASTPESPPEHIQVRAAGLGSSNTTVNTPVLEIVTLEFPPLEGADQDGVPRGAAVEVVTEVFRSLDLVINIRVFPWTRSLQLVKEGKADAIFTAYRKSEREVFLDYTNEVLVNQVVSLYVKSGSKNGFTGNMRDLRGKTIGVVSTISYGDIFDEASKKYGLKLDRVNELQQNLKKLMSDRINYVVSNRYTAAVELERLGLTTSVTELPVPVEITPSFLAFSKAKKHADLVPRFDAALKKLKSSGRYKEILARHKVVPP